MTSISIFGLGYVGSVAAGCLNSQGCKVIGVDVHPEKVARINAGKAPIHEPGLDPLLAAGIAEGRLHATSNVAAAVEASDVSIICVGTPSDATGALNLDYVETVSAQIRDAIGTKPRHRVVFRSTMLPGSTRRLAEKHFRDLIEAGRVDVFFFPEFLRQGAAVNDYLEPSLSVLGAYHEGQSIDGIEALFPPETERVDLETAELLKYSCNAFHAAKVAFANEIGRIGKGLGLDSRRVMELLCRDTRLNISPSYLRPGNPFGGSCLPKDVSALNVLAASLGVSAPTLGSLLPSNHAHLDHLRALVGNDPTTEIAIVGLAFKHDTDDLRGSALLTLAAELLRAGHPVRIFDPYLKADALIGASRVLVEQQLPSLGELMCPTVGETLGERGIVLASNRCVPVESLAPHLTAAHRLIDVTGWTELAHLPGYEGICW
jgi:GDP-mannose 6-dehydrogenase